MSGSDTDKRCWRNSDGEEYEFLKRSNEYKKIDTGTQVLSVTDYIMTEELVKSSRKRKKKKHKSENLGKKSKHGYNLFYSLLNIFMTCLVLISVYRYQLLWSTDEPMSLIEMNDELRTSVLGQNLVIDTIVNGFEKFEESLPKVVITCLVGSTGVGKSYVLNIIKKHFASRFVHSLEPNDLIVLSKKENYVSIQFQSRITSNPYNIVILDDLRITDLNNAKTFLKNAMKIKDLNIQFILAFNIQYNDEELNYFINYDDSSIIKNQLAQLTDNFYFCNFTEVSKDSLQLFLKSHLIARNVDQSSHDNIINEILENHDTKFHGFKRVIRKLELELRENGYEVNQILN